MSYCQIVLNVVKFNILILGVDLSLYYIFAWGMLKSPQTIRVGRRALRNDFQCIR